MQKKVEKARTNYESCETLSFSTRPIPFVVTNYCQHKTREDEYIDRGQYPLLTYIAESYKL